MRNRIQSNELKSGESRLSQWRNDASDFTKSCDFMLTFVQLLNFFAVRQKVEDRALKNCLQSPYLISPNSFCLWHNFLQLPFSLLQCGVNVDSKLYFNDKKMLWRIEDVCHHMSFLAKQTHIIYARDWFILINAQHLTAENILDSLLTLFIYLEMFFTGMKSSIVSRGLRLATLAGR